MENPEIPVNECQEILNRAEQIYKDKKIRGVIGIDFVYSVIRFATRNEYITQRQKEALESVWEQYQRIVELNSGYEEGLRESAISLLDEIMDLSKPFVSADRCLQGVKGNAVVEFNKIKRGKYFWNTHIEPSYRLLQDIQEAGAEIGDLEERIKSLIERVSLKRE